MSELIGSAIGVATKVVDTAMNVYGTIQDAKIKKAQQKLAESAFQESVRQFGLNAALQRFATTEGISMQQAQQAYNMITGVNTLANEDQAANQQNTMNDFSMRSSIQSEESRKRLGNAFAKGAAIGMRNSVSNKVV